MLGGKGGDWGSGEGGEGGKGEGGGEGDGGGGGEQHNSGSAMDDPSPMSPWAVIQDVSLLSSQWSWVQVKK